MKSRLIPGRIRPISFIFVIPLVILSLTIGLIIGQITFNLAVDYRLHQLEAQISPCEVTESPQSEDNAKMEQVFDQASNKAEIDSLGQFTISHYCPCAKCCGKTDGITKTGTIATENRTIAVDPTIIPLGTEVIIDGQTYVAEDIGGAIKQNKIDVYVSDHREALSRGVIQREVFKAN